ncbi:MAG: hypothetical protein GF404_08175 [candidate division Zixibacteria bacterium]|nr:hypothetical protein [candidate division Zixibacteria bacterium]
MPIDLDKFNIYGRDENAETPILIGFTGKQEDLERLGIRLDWISETTISTSIKLKMLPLLCQVKGVQRIKSQPIPDLELNYSTDDINCVYSNVQTNLKVSGDSVIVGIIDGGLDWLHEDFIDSSGNTRIRYFWDQSDSSGLNPINPAFNFFSKHSNILFHKHC